MSFLTIFFVFTASLFLLLIAGKILLQSVVGIARALRLSEFMAAFILVSFATSIPELFVGLSSAAQDLSGVSLGDVLGSNFLALTLIVGIPAIISGHIRGQGKISSHNFTLILLLAFLPIALSVDGIISRIDGIILLAAFAVYIHKLFQDKEHYRKELADGEDGLEAPYTAVHILKLAFYFVVGAFLLLVSSFALIWASKALLVEYVHVGFVYFGFIFVAIGTSVPEIVFGIRAALGKYSSAVLGNALGSIAFNAGAIIGLVALIRPIEVDFVSDLLAITIFLFVGFSLFYLFVYTQNKLSRKEGFVLLFLYFVFLAVTMPRCLECIIY